MSEDSKFIDIRPRYQKVRRKNLAGVLFCHGIADCSNLDDAGFAGVLKYMKRCYNGRAISYGELQAQTSRPARPVPDVPSIVPAGGGTPPPTGDSGERDADPPTRDEGSPSGGDGPERTETVKVREAVELLDIEDDDHWTAEGLPRIDAVAELSGVHGVSRDQINIAAPDFVRPEIPKE